MGKIKGVYKREGMAYIRYQDETGTLVRESTQQRSLKAAETILAQRKTEVAMRKNFPTRAFEDVRFGDLIDFWWDLHGRQTRSRFEYRLPRVRTRFAARRARDISSSMVEEFLDQLQRDGFAASSVNQHRTILNSVFNFAIKREKYDRNPVAVVAQRKEPPGRDRYLTADEFKRLIKECRPDPQLYAFVWLAGTTGARKGELLARTWQEVDLDGVAPHVYVPRSKNGRSKRLPLAAEVVTALKKLPSYGHDPYLFPVERGNVRFTGKREYLWDMRKPFQAACDRAGIKGIRIHDLRHMATTILFLEGIPEAIIRKLTGHRSRELERYEHLSPGLKNQTVELIARTLSGTPTDTGKPTQEEETAETIERNGGDDGARTRDLRRDRPAF
jgi:integrase